MISVEIISVSFDASFEDLICSWEKKHLQRKSSFPEMVGNHFFFKEMPCNLPILYVKYRF